MSGDDAAANALRTHFATGAAERHGKWRHRLYDLIAGAGFCERDPRVSIGADNFPYYALDVPPAGAPRGTIAIPALIDLATSRGFGISVHCGAADPWVFSCGDLVTRRAFGTYEFPRVGVAGAAGPVFRAVHKEPADVSIGAPSATLLPGFVQPLLRRYFTEILGIAEPGALAMLSARQDPPEQLVFRLSRADFRGEREFEAALAGVTWFLPRHIVVSVLPPDVVAGLDRVFVPL